jgi:pSer/pThr/pTyr-binding forkhead associated (FHA) protein
MAELCRISEEGEVLARWEIGAKPLVVGRDEFADARINDESLSRHHFVVLRSGDNYLIQDLGSANGTWVNGGQVTVALLPANAWVCTGRTVFVFRLQSQAAQWVVVPGGLAARREAEMQPIRPTAA